MKKLTAEQKLAIVCAYCDLVGAKEAMERGDLDCHDWDGHKRSIKALRKVFPFVKK
jgi:hypothetical protein